jgi:hypothetical protein
VFFLLLAIMLLLGKCSNAFTQIGLRAPRSFFDFCQRLGDPLTNFVNIVLGSFATRQLSLLNLRRLIFGWAVIIAVALAICYA